MGDEIEHEIKGLSGVLNYNVVLKIPIKLNDSNWPQWSLLVERGLKSLMRSHFLTKDPLSSIITELEAEDNGILMALFNTMEPDVMSVAMNCVSSKKLWEHLQTSCSPHQPRVGPSLIILVTSIALSGIFIEEEVSRLTRLLSSKAYFITNMEPIKFWEFMALILVSLGYERPRIKIPAFVVMPIACMVERIYHMLAPYGMKVPQLTPSRIRLLSCSRTFCCSKANDRIGYIPIVPLQEGLKRTIESYSDLRAELLPRKEGPSKAAVYVGNGTVADVLLWRNTKLTLTAMLVLIAFYINFVLPGHTMITAISKVLMMASVFLFIHGKLPDNLMGYSVEKIPESKFFFSDDMSRRTASSVASSWNCAMDSLKSICNANDWELFFKMALSLYIVSLIGSMSLQSFFVKVLPFAFVAFYVYEQNEDEIDGFLRKVLPIGCLSNPNFLRLLNPFQPLGKHD